MKTLKEKLNLNGLAGCLFEAVVGVLLLINPVGFTSGIIVAAGVVMMIAGLVNVVKYFRLNAKEGAVSQLLTQGLLMLLCGWFCAFRSEWFIATFPVLTLLYGVAMLFSGLSKIQLTIDLIRQKNRKWFLGAIAAALSIICAVIVLNSPFATAAVLWMFTGVSLIVEAVMDGVALLFSSREN